MSNGGQNFERISHHKLSGEDLELKLDRRRGSRTERFGKERNKTRRARNEAAKRDYADA
jgi:hypothetical protein